MARLNRKKRRTLRRFLLIVSCFIVVLLLVVLGVGVCQILTSKQELSSKLEGQTIVASEGVQESQTVASSKGVQESQTVASSEDVQENQTVASSEDVQENQTVASSEGVQESQTVVSSESELSLQQQTSQASKPSKEKEQLVIELDPGHGGTQSGAEHTSDKVAEKTVNLNIGLFLKEELETYENVTVYLTRADDEDVKLEDRVQKAVKDKADVIISLHNNAVGEIADYNSGCTVLTARGAYQEDLAQTGQELGCYILNALSDIGVENQGLMFRICQNKETYPNKELCDYYNIIRNATLAGMPGIIVEHCFIDNDEDYQKFLSSDEALRLLAKADARGIASYYQLKSKDGGSTSLEVLDNYTEKVTLIQSDYSKDNEYFTKKYFTSKQ